MSSPRSFKPDGVFLLNVLGSPNPIKVPDYQRDFSWESRHVADFWDDLIAFERACSRVHGPSEYFLGSIVIVQGGQHQELLDGQQRLATSTILLAVIRNRLRTLDPKAADHIHASFIALENPLDRGHAPAFRLELNAFDGDFFRRVAQEERNDDPPRPTHDSHRRILAARRLLERSVDDLLSTCKSDEDRASRLLRLANLLTHRFAVIQITSTDEDQAASVFETLNDRGTSLRTEDLLRSHLLSKAPKNARRDIIRLWGEISKTSKGPGIEGIIRTSWIAVHGDVKTRALYKEIKDHLVEHKVSPLEYVRELHRDAEYLKKLAAGTTGIEAVDGPAQELVQLQASKAHCTLLAAHNQGLDAKECVSLARALVALAIRHNLICRWERSKMESAVCECARLISTGAKLDTALQPLRAISPTNEEVAASFKRLALKSKRAARVVLCGLESARHRTKEMRVASPRLVHVEHILPIRPRNGHKKKDHEKYVHRLGNLTLFDGPRNISVSNGPYANKKKKYAESELLITREIPERYVKWSKEAIRQRQDSLLPEVNRVWPHSLIH
jgi:hypothetical protein